MKLVLVGLVALSACAHEIDELGSFPCPINNECPEGRVCSAGQCVIATLGAECHSKFEDSCAAGAPTTDCYELDPSTNTGTCEYRCDSDEQCDGARCSSMQGICQVDCGAEPCTPGTECVAVDAGLMRCVPEAAPEHDEPCEHDAQCKLRDHLAFCFKANGAIKDGVCARSCVDGAVCAALGPRVCVSSADFRNGCMTTCAAGESRASFRCEVRFGPGGARENVWMPYKLRDEGQRCDRDDQCGTMRCVVEASGGGRCVQRTPCASDDACSAGFTCLQSPNGFGYCWPQSSRDPGCSTTRSGSLLTVLAVLLVRRRRRPCRRRCVPTRPGSRPQCSGAHDEARTTRPLADRAQPATYDTPAGAALDTTDPA